ncbi:MAG: prolyl oligopeptidase family serine peptidase [Synechococcaceae cyanobacterium]
MATTSEDGAATTVTSQGNGPLSARQALADSVALKEPLLAAGWLYWLEQRPAEQGRTTLLRRPALDPQAPPQELSPAPINLRSRVHSYGGGVYAVGAGQLVMVDDRDRCLWLRPLPESGSGPLPPARQLTPPADPNQPRAFADGLVDPERQRWIGVMEQSGRDLLVAVPLAGGEPEPLWRPADFCGYATLSPDGLALAWVEWQQPHMPWERSQLWLAAVSADGRLEGARQVAGSEACSERGISVFQPLWAGADLVVANDRSGWWNLERLAKANVLRPEAPAHWQPLLPMRAEFALPQWVYGLRTTAWDGQELLAAACVDGCWQLGRLAPKPVSPDRPDPETPSHGWHPINTPCDDLAYLVAAAGRLVAVGSGPDRPSGLLEVELPDGGWRHSPVAAAPLTLAALSHPEALWFPGHAERPTHAWYYPPQGTPEMPAPLLVRGHSGPTAMARTGLNPALQFWTSRGWGVVEVNYGGSTGFGRAYRERLDGGWGVVDVDDCLAAVQTLVAAGRADPERVAMEGGSAAGFTVLEALARDGTLKAGCCRYPVTDLTALASDAGEHRFEARYFDTLIGPWPQARSLYEQRSPLRHPQRINAPVILFHGLEDPVVPPRQTEALALALQERGVPVELHLFPGEGHGFRDRAVQQRVLEATEAFFHRQLRL